MFDAAVISAIKSALADQAFIDLSAARLKALVRDLCAGREAEANLLSIAVDAKIPQELARLDALGDLESARLQDRLKGQYFIGHDAAEWAVQGWATALGLVQSRAIESPAPPQQQTVSDSPKIAMSQEIVSQAPNRLPAIVALFAVVASISVGIYYWQAEKHDEPSSLPGASPSLESRKVPPSTSPTDTPRPTEVERKTIAEGEVQIEQLKVDFAQAPLDPKNIGVEAHFYPDGSHLMISRFEGSDQNAEEGGNGIAVYETSPWKFVGHIPDEGYKVGVSPDSTKIVGMTDKELVIWDAKSLGEMTRFGLNGVRQLFTNVHFSADSQSVYDNNVFISLNAGKTRHIGKVGYVYDYEGDYLVGEGRYDGQLSVWPKPEEPNAESRAVRNWDEAFEGLSDKGSYLFCGLNSGNSDTYHLAAKHPWKLSKNLYEFDKAKSVQRFSVVASEAGHIFACASEDGFIWVADLEDGHVLAKFSVTDVMQGVKPTGSIKLALDRSGKMMLVIRDSHYALVEISRAH